VSLVRACRQLRRQPLVLVVALILACLVGVAIPYKLPSMSSRQYQVGIASASALVDSARSQVADLGNSTGTDVGTLAYRASLFASLMTTSPLRDEIARSAGISPGELIASGPTPVASSNSPAPAVSGASISSSSPKASTLSASVATLPAGQLPVIQVNTQGPTPAIAAKLANGAFAALQHEIDAVAGADNIPVPQRVVVRLLGPAAATSARLGPGLLSGILGAVLAFVLVCGAVVGISSFRAALRDESTQDPGVLDPDQAPLHDPDSDQALLHDLDRALQHDLPHSAPIVPEPVQALSVRAEARPDGGQGAQNLQEDYPTPPARAPRARTILSRASQSVAPQLARVPRSGQRRVRP
jgi:hypothetical protein